MKAITMEVQNDNVVMDLLEGDEVMVDLAREPRGNGKELGLFEVDGEKFVSRFTRFGKQLLFLGEGQPIRPIYADRVRILGTVIEDTEKAPAATGAHEVKKLQYA